MIAVFLFWVVLLETRERATKVGGEDRIILKPNLARHATDYDTPATRRNGGGEREFMNRAEERRQGEGDRDMQGKKREGGVGLCGELLHAHGSGERLPG